MPPRWLLLPVERGPRDADVLVPVLVDLLHRWPEVVGGPLLSYAAAGLLQAGQEQRIADVVGPPLARTLDELRADYARGGRAVVWSDAAYLDRRIEAGQTLDMLGHCCTADVDGLLARAAGHPDPWLALWGVVGLHRRGHAPPADGIRRAAADPESRNVLYDAVGDLVPAEYRTQAMLAESDMVRWLLWPSELGRLPDDIELVTVVPMAGQDHAPADLYVFRFRTLGGHWTDDKGWLVGVSGPFLRHEQPTTASLGMTFSMFQRYSDRSVREHVQEITGTLGDWRGALR